MGFLVVQEDHVEARGEKGVDCQGMFHEIGVKFFLKNRRGQLHLGFERFDFFVDEHLALFDVISQRNNVHIQTLEPLIKDLAKVLIFLLGLWAGWWGRSDASQG